MKINIRELITIQQEVNRKIKEKASDAITNEQFILAFNIELFEYFNAIGIWKWWKHSHEIKKERVLDELADCFAFFLSLLDNQIELDSGKEEGDSIIDKVEKEIQHYLGVLDGFRTDTDLTVNEIVTDLITYIVTDNESENSIFTVERFAVAIFIGITLFPGITWEEITKAYKEKSAVNIQRQVDNY